MNKNLQNKLKTYSALTAVAVVAASNAEAQMNVTTVDYAGGYESYDIDLDGDAVVDFTLHGLLSSSSYYAALQVQGKTGNDNVFFTSNSYYAAVTNDDTKLNSYDGFGFRGLWQLDLSYGINGGNLLGGYVSSGGVFSSLWGRFDGATDKFVGLRFRDENNETHYGWLRLSVNSPGDWTLKSYGYEEQSYVSAFTNAAGYDTDLAALTTKDVSNKLNASDLEITVTPDATHTYFAEVSDYKVVIQKADERYYNVWDLINSNGTDLVEDGSTSHTISLDAWDVDSDGDLILHNQPYDVFLVTMDNNGSPLRYAKSTITLNGTVGVETLSNEVNISSVNNTLNISLSNINNAQVVVNDIMGKVIVNESIISSNYSKTLNVSEGIYLVTVSSAEGKVTKKIKF